MTFPQLPAMLYPLLATIAEHGGEGQAAEPAGAPVLPNLVTIVATRTHGPLGEFLHALMGYEAQPPGMQVLFFCVVLSVVYTGTRLVRRRSA